MKLTIDLGKTVDENASAFFEKAKISRRKMAGAKRILKEFSSRQKEVSTQEVVNVQDIKKLIPKKKLWFEKFKWFITSDNYFVIAARDATTNEILIKKHTLPNDVVFHTDMAGSPFVIIKTIADDITRVLKDEEIEYEKTVPESTIQEAASFTAIHSRAWRLGMGSSDVFYVKPEQVSKEANTGEFMSKGSFMIRGETNYVVPSMDFSVGLIGVYVVGGPTSAIEKHCKTFVTLIQGNEKASVVARHIRSVIIKEQEVDVPIDAIVSVLPSGGCQVKKERRRKK